MTVGILAFHGDIAEHVEILHALKARSLEVRTKDDLSKVKALIIPGGESTVISRFLDASGLREEIQRRVKEESMPVFGTCAGAILLARHVTGKNPPRTLRLMDITVERNAYGTQAQSFEGFLRIKGIKGPLSVAYIRAPKIVSMKPGVEVLSSHEGTPMLVRQGKLLASTFHPEIRGTKDVHRLFLDMA